MSICLSPSRSDLMFKLNVDQIIGWLQNRFKILLSFFVLCVLIGLGGIFFEKWNKKQEEQIKDSLATFEKSLKSLVKEPEGQSNPFDLAEKEEELVFTDEMKTQAEAYKKAIEEKKKYKISAYFAIDLADFYYRYGEKETAIQLLSSFSSPPSKGTLGQLASFQLATYYMNDDKCDLALDLFEKIISNKSAEGFYKESRLQKAICLENLKSYESALQEYESLAVENPDTYIARQAKDYKRLLILKQKLNKEGSSEKSKVNN